MSNIVCQRIFTTNVILLLMNITISSHAKNRSHNEDAWIQEWMVRYPPHHPFSMLIDCKSFRKLTYPAWVCKKIKNLIMVNAEWMNFLVKNVDHVDHNWTRKENITQNWYRYEYDRHLLTFVMLPLPARLTNFCSRFVQI